MVTLSPNLPIALPWFNRPSPEVAPDLLGCSLVRRLPDGQVVRGVIVETEAYAPGDPACHAYRRRTPRNSIMFGPAGQTYVYLIYGMYHCLNVVTDADGLPSAVLIRALQLDAIPNWISPNSKSGAKLKVDRIAAGPGKLCQSLQIDLSLTAKELHPTQPLWIEHRSPQFVTDYSQNRVSFVQTTRIGLTQGVDIPWRWYVKGCPAVSKV